MLSGRDDPGESRMGEISMSGSTRERAAAVIGLWAFHSVLSSLLYWFRLPFLGSRNCRHNPGGARQISSSLGGESESIVASGMGIEPVFPEFIEAAAGLNAAQGQYVYGTGFTPEHARLLAAGTDDGFAPGFDDA